MNERSLLEIDHKHLFQVIRPAVNLLGINDWTRSKKKKGSVNMDSERKFKRPNQNNNKKNIYNINECILF